MKKFMRDMKTAVGTAPKTEDKEYDHLCEVIKQVEKANQEYKSATQKMIAASKTMATAIENMGKAYGAMTSDSETPESMKAIAKACQEAATKIHDEHLAAYTKALDEDSVAPMKELRTKLAALKKLEASRNKVMAEYDTYREDVSKKEKDYEKKGKDLSESKGYAEDVKKRDELHTQYEEENKKFKEEAEAVNKERLHAFLHAMKDFSAHTSTFFAAMEKDMEHVNATAKKTSL